MKKKPKKKAAKFLFNITVETDEGKTYKFKAVEGEDKNTNKKEQ